VVVVGLIAIFAAVVIVLVRYREKIKKRYCINSDKWGVVVNLNLMLCVQKWEEIGSFDIHTDVCYQQVVE